MGSVLYFVSFVAVLYVQCISMHLGNAECPSHKPYYTEAGCVYSCPKEFHINGSSCIVTCGDWFTNTNKECQLECQDSYFVREVVRAVGRDSYLEKQCVASCDSTEFIFNGTCVEACPTDLMFIVNKACVDSCPDGFPFLDNFTKSGLLYYECLETCPIYEEDNSCTNSCSEGRLKLNNKCVETCPKSQQYIYANQCLKHCPSWWPIDAIKTCVTKCPPHLPLIHNNSCVVKCPKEFPNSDMRADGSEHCVDVCGQKTGYPFLSNNECVPKCPNYTYNRTCMNKCPNDFPVANNVTIGKNCNYDSECTKILQYDECVEECPTEKFLLLQQKVCIETCPSNMVLLNHTCVHSCDEKFPYSQETTVTVTTWSSEEDNNYGGSKVVWKKISKKEIIQQCVNDCSENNLQLNDTCVQRCPGLTDMPADLENLWNETSQYFRYGRTCVRKCPEDHKFVTRGEKHCWSRNCDDTGYLKCVAECQWNTYIYRNICLKLCPDHLFLLGKTCVESCPQKQHLHMKREISVYVAEHLRWEHVGRIECVSNCGEKLVYNNSCLDSCPVNRPYLSSEICHNNTCGTKFEYKTSKGIECLIECPGGTLRSANKCTSNCPDELKYNFNSVCVKACPSSKPFGVDINKDSPSFYHKNSEFKCLAECEGDKIYKQDENTCIYSNRCDDPYFEFAGQCLKRCPNDYKWFLSCFHWNAVLIFTIFFVLLTFIYIFCCFPLFKETYKFIRMCRLYTKHYDGEDRAENLLQLWNEEESNNPGEAENTSRNIADTVIIQTINNMYMNNAFETDINIEVV